MQSAPNLPKLLLLGSDNATTWMVYNRLVREFGLFDAIIEDVVDKRTLLRVRARKLGWPAVLSQIAFVALIRPALRYQASRRLKHICREHDLETKRPFTTAIHGVDNINGPMALAMIREQRPDIVIVNGTRILKAQLLHAVGAVFVNTHQGFTPMYRGAHGAYWALHENDPAHCGVTVHVVDEGIDTGNIIAQTAIQPSPDDSYITYPYLQTAAALPLLTKFIRDSASAPPPTSLASGTSGVWYHPGFFQYLKARLRGVR